MDSIRKEVLQAAEKTVCQDRQDAYGQPEDNFGLIAILWSVYLGGHSKKIKITPSDVAIMMILLKVARIGTGVYNTDNYIDIAGYAACGAEIEETLHGNV